MVGSVGAKTKQNKTKQKADESQKRKKPERVTEFRWRYAEVRNSSPVIGD